MKGTENMFQKILNPRVMAAKCHRSPACIAPKKLLFGSHLQTKVSLQEPWDTIRSLQNPSGAQD